MNKYREQRDSIEKRRASLADEQKSLMLSCPHENVLTASYRMNDEWDSHAWYADTYKCTDCGKQWTGEPYQ